jgi:hypothetical protein
LDAKLRDAFYELTGREFDEFDSRARDFAAGWRAAMRLGAGLTMANTAPAPLVHPQGVMGIPPYSPQASASAAAAPGILPNANRAGVPEVARLIVEYGDARQTCDAAAVQMAFRALVDVLPEVSGDA